VVDIVAEGKVLARAIASLGAEDLRAARGRRSGELEKVLGRKGPFNVTRKGNLLLL
jgi:glutamate 5-kinase